MTEDLQIPAAGRRVLLINPPVVVVDRVQLDYYADAQPYGLLQIAGLLKQSGVDVGLIDLMGYGKHDRTWDDLEKSGELRRTDPLAAGAPGVRLDARLYGRSFDDFEARLAGEPREPDEVWVTCSMLFNAFLAREVIRIARRRFPSTHIRLGGGYAALNPEHAALSGADEVFRGRVHAADLIKPDSASVGGGLNFALFRLTDGCPNRCTFCVNGRTSPRLFPIDAVMDYILEVHERTGIRRFNNWDPNILQFKPHLYAFLDEAARRGPADLELRFDMGLEPPKVDEELAERLSAARVRAFTVPVETSEPRMAALFAKPYTIISSIRAMRILKDRGPDPSGCHASYIIGMPEETWTDIFTTYRVIRFFGLRSTPFPITPLPGSPIHRRYRNRLEGRPFRELNGHLWPLIDDPRRLNLYRRLILLLAAATPDAADALIARFPEEIRTAYASGALRADRLIEAALGSDEKDGPALLRKITKTCY